MTSEKGIYALDLRLLQVEHLFSAPGLSPFSPEYREHNYTSGIEFIADELYANTSYNRVRLTLVLPPDQITPGLETEIRTAIGRYCRGRLKDIEHQIHASRWRGRRALLLAILALIVFTSAAILLASVITPENAIILGVVSEGLAIAAWVALWVPLEMLLFTVWEHRLDYKIYTLLLDMELIIEPAAVAD